MNGWDYDSIESKDELYSMNDLFLLEMDNFIDKRKCIFSVTLSDNSTNELYCIWNFYDNTECWEFGSKWVLINVKEQILMKHVVKCTVVVETESTDLKEIARLGLEDIIKRVNDEFVVVDVYRNCTAVEMICVHNKDMKEGNLEGEKGKNRG